ncbi:nucleocytoplasmic transporter NUP145 NDAI_0I01270 [Naumovozyma dairenensis CBS 421]|uniref:Peptidase S59 domain-containing protein n=1 Tax=Naumovozyma dairenensis (strain ATCC 10597 / BCRC 20456 / CBS 421 / NBRC 0211 / NRRL Y-12639) TaxID=1071378 RepID=G0WFY5_NAUDC|nr:hypothetical protein NDAI_0I01270 [Naumovozyma dairenensis CBS 421]CCD26696.1 hypothetical protein NDAI_0I01270 [Naumovozyma dairenensis CBS 421]
MFNRTMNGGGNGSLFGNLNTSTPTSTPIPNANPQQLPKTDGLFGKTLNAGNIGTSTPSPAGGPLFGANNTNNNNNNNQTSLFGNSNNNANMNQQPAQVPTGGLFGNSATTNNNNNAGSLFGNTNTNQGNMMGGAPTGQSLFGNSKTATGGGGLFGNSSTNNTMNNFSLGGSNSNTLKTGFGTGNSLGSSAATGGLFGNSTGTTTTQQQQLPPTGLFGNITNNTFQPQQQQAQQLTSNPYGLNINNISAPVATMPESITGSLLKGNLKKSTNDDAHNNNNYRNAHRSSSISSTIAALPPVSRSSLFNKLNTRLNTIHDVSTRGLFSSPSPYNERSNPSTSKFNNPLNSQNLNLGSNSIKDFSFISSNRRNDISELRKLKIDSNRIAAKKLKLLSGEPSITKQEAMEDKNTINTNTEDPSSLQEKGSLKDINDNKENIIGNAMPQVNGVEAATDISPEQQLSKPTNDNGYWCSPSPDQLRDMPLKKLTSVSSFVIGRKGYGYITFNDTVDLLALINDIENNLFGNIVIFHSSKTVEVYPDESEKPPIGYGLNVPATITLENIYPVDKVTKKVMKNASNINEIQLLTKKLKTMRGMEFISYDPFGGIWTFKVKHFSIWGLIDEEDVEISQEEIDSMKNQQKKEKEREAKEDDVTTSKQLVIMYNKADQQQQEQQQLQMNPEAIEEEFGEERLDDLIVEEKQYEPDVTEQDFEGLEADPSLDIANDWVDQLHLAGSSLRSVFAKSSAIIKPGNDEIDLLFSDFNEEFEKEKKIKKERRLVSPYHFGKFTNNYTFLLKNVNKKTGVHNSLLSSTLKDKLILKDKNFDLHLAHVTIDKRDSNAYPIIRANSLQFKDLISLVNKADIAEKNVWELSSILFDNIELNYNVEDENVKMVLLKNKRLETLNSWIVNQVRDELEFKLRGCTDVLDQIFIYLLLNDVTNATKLSIKSSNGHLAILLTYLGSNDPRVRELGLLQLNAWKSNGQKVDSKIVRIYQLISGTLFQDSSNLDKLLDEFSWLSLLGLSLYYCKIDEYSLEDLILAHISLFSPVVGDKKIYYLFQLFGVGTDSTENLFKEIQLKSNDIDIQFSWYFVQILKFNKIRSFSAELLDLFSLQFIEDLTHCQWYKEALYVSCFISNEAVNKQQIDLILNQKISTLFNDTSNILEDLKIPSTLIHNALALVDIYNGDNLSAVENLLSAKCYMEAEKVMRTVVGPHLLLLHSSDATATNNGNLIILRKLISSFPKESMSNWINGLSVFENYLKITLDNETNKTVVECLLSELIIFYENNKYYRDVPICCNIISNEIVDLILEKFKKEVDENYKKSY